MALCYNPKFRDWSIGAAREGETTFPAVPDADAYAFDSFRNAVGALVGLLGFGNDFHVAFSECCAVASA